MFTILQICTGTLIGVAIVHICDKIYSRVIYGLYKKFDINNQTTDFEIGSDAFTENIEDAKHVYNETMNKHLK